MRVMIVDDSKNMRQIVANALIEAFPQLELFFAGNGEEAEATLQENRVLGTPMDVVCLDWMMPKMSGIEFLMSVRATEFFAVNPKIIMLTAETYSEQMNACLKYGVSAYVTKPFTKADIVSAFLKVTKDLEGFKHAV